MRTKLERECEQEEDNRRKEITFYLKDLRDSTLLQFTNIPDYHLRLTNITAGQLLEYYWEMMRNTYDDNLFS